jgi:glycosyltransferase involved in cell wall biosynthesis
VKLSLMIPTHSNADTIASTLESALAQRHRPLEVVVYDEASADGTRGIAEELLSAADTAIETRLLTSEENSGPVRAWRVALHEITGDWCCFVWSDDILKPDFSTTMMAAAERAAEAGRTLVTCSAEVENKQGVLPYLATDTGLATPLEYSEGIFLRRFPLTQICSVYPTDVARRVFDRHIDIDNPRGYDYSRHAYGNDVGFLSELAMEGGGVELVGERLVRLVMSPRGMTNRATGDHLWQMRWQYTYAFLRVWRWWAERGIEGADRLVGMAERRLALCSLMVGGARERSSPGSLVKGVRAYFEYRRLDYQVNKTTLDEHRAAVGRSAPSDVSQPSVM